MSDQAKPKRIHPLAFVTKKGLLTEALGISRDDPDSLAIEDTVERALNENWNMRNLFQTVGAMHITDEMWANFLYTYGFWDGQRREQLERRPRN